MQHLAPLGMLLTSFSKHSVLIPRGQSVSAVTGGGVEYFREDRQHTDTENTHTESYLSEKSVRCFFDCVCKCVCKWRHRGGWTAIT